MRLGHVAALSLLGWYLMMPPHTSDGRADYHAPLKDWSVLTGFDSAQSCKDDLRKQQAMLSKLPNSPLRDHLQNDFFRAKCVMLDYDPFFKKIARRAKSPRASNANHVLN